ncbi:extracellular solute-binding protein [Mycetocola zhujimingii]|uniref:ABC transporter substrate-binding protein n=1 Tax=Mycetocola zhujimingii TaxID=2079792 RepID=A0A2U1THG4_9MICO|nr:extracellular solute-binding protein [Mycetocola zhujimingii]PWC08337.1 ABC transporter substrate-binding protein [Mycetocola zhujimingii]
MRKRSKHAALLVVATVALTTACSSSGNGGEGEDGVVTLTISTFNEWGYSDLLTEYEELNPGIKVEHNRFATTDEAKEQFQTALGAGSGLADVVGVDNSWLPEIVEYSDGFADLNSDSVEGRWNDWTTDLATTPDGKLLGYATDIGPQVIAYRADLFEAAGLPTDREQVEELFGGADATWEDFFTVGDQFMAAGTGPAFYDAAESVANAQLDQREITFEDPESGELIGTTSDEVREIYDNTLAHNDLSAHLARWTEDWNTAFQTDGFAAMLAPSWMLGVIEGNAAGVEGWDVANVFPGGGVNSGGSYLTVPTTSEHPEEAQALADWLTAPEQQLKAFQTTGNFPSQVEAQEGEDLQQVTSAFFNDAPTGEIFSEQASRISVVPFKGMNYFAALTYFDNAIRSVDVDGQDASKAWDQFVNDVETLE